MQPTRGLPIRIWPNKWFRRLLIAGEGNWTLEFASGNQERLLATLHPYLLNVSRLAFTPDGTRLATAHGDGSIKFWDLSTHQEVLTLKAHPPPTASRLAFVPDGNTLVSGSADGIRFWRAPSFEDVANAESSSGAR